ncbi:unnamed protein product [Protopolystoma xenopodis]|uniref:Uncharacterized protein n=1 Tax=Protopolystoma xenopodis TaxID=117903 RepID=A0A3S5AGK4_9PLAT|nr:unnamed protein product [Protopolystoma xenopodis]
MCLRAHFSTLLSPFPILSFTPPPLPPLTRFFPAYAPDTAAHTPAPVLSIPLSLCFFLSFSPNFTFFALAPAATLTPFAPPIVTPSFNPDSGTSTHAFATASLLTPTFYSPLSPALANAFFRA